MVDLGVLDNVIGVIVVILLLSMVVQSVQTFLKKLLNFKSSQIRKSLEDLFERTAPTAPPAGAASAQAVIDHFKDMGRVTAFNGSALESISKADLSKVVATIEASSVLPQKTKETLSSLLGAVTKAQAAIDALANTPMPETVVAKLAELRQEVMPLLAHAGQIVDAQGKMKAELIVKDVTALRGFVTADLLRLVAEVQGHLEQAAAGTPADAVLQKAVVTARELTKAAAELHGKLAELGAHLRERIEAIEAWYDPIMQGFEERYARHMKTWAFVLAAIVTIAVDANLPRLYKRMATDDVSKARVLSEATAIQQRYMARIEQARMDNNQPMLRELTARLNDEVDEATSSYPALGLEMLDIEAFWNRTTLLEKIKIVMGWILMAFLLSLGAPFWHDALQSIFGLKNYLRNKTDTQKVEQEPGAGATS